jgi:hypothetical protein
MVQRYYATHPNAGANFYQTYPAASTVTGGAAGFPSIPSALAELGVAPGTRMRGNLNTDWMFGSYTSGAASVAGGGTVYLNPTTFAVTPTTVTGGVTGTVLVPVTSLSGGVWAEVSGAVLNTVMATGMEVVSVEGQENASAGQESLAT